MTTAPIAAALPGGRNPPAVAAASSPSISLLALNELALGASDGTNADLLLFIFDSSHLRQQRESDAVAVVVVANASLGASTVDVLLAEVVLSIAVV